MHGLVLEQAGQASASSVARMMLYRTASVMVVATSISMVVSAVQQSQLEDAGHWDRCWFRSEPDLDGRESTPEYQRHLLPRFPAQLQRHCLSMCQAETQHQEPNESTSTCPVLLTVERSQ